RIPTLGSQAALRKAQQSLSKGAAFAKYADVELLFPAQLVFELLLCVVYRPVDGFRVVGSAQELSAWIDYLYFGGIDIGTVPRLAGVADEFHFTAGKLGVRAEQLFQMREAIIEIG